MSDDFCEYCNATLSHTDKLVSVHRQRNGQHFIFERVPARVCHRCGERYFASHVVREMEALMKEPAERNNMVEVPVIALRPAG
jgi:YgiT-type zinc finger domain-containing protein